MLGAIDIANLALSHIGVRSNIESFTQRKPEAEQANLWYDPCRRQVLAAFDWSFARRRQVLSLDTEAPPNGWGYRYRLPSDLLIARRLYNPIDPIERLGSPPIPYQIETKENKSVRTMLANEREAVLIYTFDCTESHLFTEYFAEAVSHLIASRIAVSLTGKRTYKDDELKIYQTMVSAAAAYDANEEQEDVPPESPLISGRH